MFPSFSPQEKDRAGSLPVEDEWTPEATIFAWRNFRQLLFRIDVLLHTTLSHKQANSMTNPVQHQLDVFNGRDLEKLFAGLSEACDFVDLAQKTYCTHPVAPL